MKDTVSMKSRIQQENLESSTPVDKTDVQTPPVRPPRENKVKPEVECGILIEL